MKFEKSMLLYKRFLLLIGILPFDGRGFNFFGTHLFLGYYVLSSVANWNMYIFYGINGGAVTVDYVCEVVLVFGIHARFYILISKRKHLKELMDECESIWNDCDEKEHRLIMKFERKIRRLFLYLLYSSNFINVLYILTTIKLNQDAVVANGTDTRILPAKWYVVDRVDAWPGYEITFFLQILIIFNSCITLSIVDSTAPMLMMFSSGFFATLRKRLDEIGETKDCRQFDEEFIAAVKFHQRLLHFSNGIEKVGRMLFLCQLLCSGYNMSIIGIKLSGTDPDRFKYLSNLFTALGELLICQYPPDYLLTESMAVSASAYSIADTLIDHRSNNGKLLVLVILRASQPVQMTAGGIVNLSMENFGQVMKSAFSFFMVLRSLHI